VPYSIAEKTKNYLDARGTPNKLLTLSGFGHCPPITPPLAYGSSNKVQEIMGFLTTYLSLPGQSCPSSKLAQSTTSTQQSTTTLKPTTTTPQNEWEEMGNGEGAVCRGKNSRDNKNSYYVLHRAVDSIEACKELCESQVRNSMQGGVDSCTGLEFNGNYRRCEVWTSPISAFKSSAKGFRCLRRTSKPAQSTTSIQQSTTTPKPTAGCDLCREPKCKENLLFKSSWKSNQCSGYCSSFLGETRSCIAFALGDNVDCRKC